MAERPPITPELKVGDLLEAYPELEETLTALSPKYRQLQNPVLRKTIGKVASLSQAARVADLPVGELINRLRQAAGATEAYVEPRSGQVCDAAPPESVQEEEEKAAVTFDARPMIEAGEQPISAVLAALNRLEAGQVLRLLTPFNPAPAIDLAKQRGFAVSSRKLDESTVSTTFRKPS